MVKDSYRFTGKDLPYEINPTPFAPKDIFISDRYDDDVVLPPIHSRNDASYTSNISNDSSESNTTTSTSSESTPEIPVHPSVPDETYLDPCTKRVKKYHSILRKPDLQLVPLSLEEMQTLHPAKDDPYQGPSHLRFFAKPARKSKNVTTPQKKRKCYHHQPSPTDNGYTHQRLMI